MNSRHWGSGSQGVFQVFLVKMEAGTFHPPGCWGPGGKAGLPGPPTLSHSCDPRHTCERQLVGVKSTVWPQSPTRLTDPQRTEPCPGPHHPHPLSKCTNWLQIPELGLRCISKLTHTEKVIGHNFSRERKLFLFNSPPLYQQILLQSMMNNSSQLA